MLDIHLRLCGLKLCCITVERISNYTQSVSLSCFSIEYLIEIYLRNRGLRIKLYSAPITCTSTLLQIERTKILLYRYIY